MPSNNIIQIVASESTPEKEAEFNKWYTEVHVPMLFAYEGVKQASRYQRIADYGQGAKFLAIYEFEDKEAMDAFPESDAFADAIQDFENNKEALGFTMKWAASYELMKSYEK